MRIAMINVTGGGMSGGYRAYFKNILPRLAAHPAVEAMLCAAPPTLAIRDWFGRLPNITFAECMPFRFARHTPDRALRELVRSFSPDVIFIPVERYLDFGNVPLVTMVQNMGPMLALPGNPMSERFRYLAQRYEAKMALRKARLVIVPTVFVRDFLIRQWGIPKQRLRVVHYGAPPPADGAAVAKPPVLPEQWGGHFIFTAGSIEPYRGLEDLLYAFAMLNESHAIKGVVIAGEARENMIGYQRSLESRIARLGIADHILWAGQLEAAEIVWCYEHAWVFAMTSRVESMSMIALEALAYGCVSVVANNPPLPEIFGSAAQYYRPKDPRDLANRLALVLGWEASKYRQAKEFARARAATFSWDTAAAQTVEVLLEAIEHV